MHVLRFSLLAPKADENLFWKNKQSVGNQFSAHKSNKNGRNLNFKSDKCKVNWFNQNPIAPLLQSKCVEQSMFFRKSPASDLKQSVPAWMESHSTMEHKIRILIDLASRAEHLSRELLQTARGGRGKVVFRDEARGSRKKASSSERNWFHFCGLTFRDCSLCPGTLNRFSKWE